MKKLIMIVGLTAIAGISVAAPATSPFNHNFVEGELVSLGTNGYHRGGLNESGDVNGLRVKGSFDVAPAFSVVGSLMDTSGSDVDIQVLTAGASYHQALPAIRQMPFALVVRAELEHVAYDFDHASLRDESETGLLLSGGVQLAIIDHLQAFHEIAISNNDYRDLTMKVGARYEFIPHLAATAAIELGDIDMLSAGLRYSF